jgi:hypothetical protein
LELRLQKCFFGLHDIEYLGYNVSYGKLSVSAKKSRPLQMGQCLRRIRRFAVSPSSTPISFTIFDDLRAPLTDLLRKSQQQKVTLMLACLETFETLNLRLISTPCLLLQV